MSHLVKLFFEETDKQNLNDNNIKWKKIIRKLTYGSFDFICHKTLIFRKNNNL